MKPLDRKRSPSSPEEWLIHAQSDLRLARLGQENNDVLPSQICFHAQQAVEKAFKAVLLFCKIDFPLTHDIQELLDIFDRASILLPYEFLDTGILTPYAVETRYPGYWGEISENDVIEAIELTEKVVKWAEEYILKKDKKIV
jgi:HEPN domain-containing protein